MPTKKQIKRRKYLNALLVFSIIILFSLITIIAIIITQGGKFTPSGIVETGSIKIELDPSRAKIEAYLDDKKIKIEDNFISNVVPGEHILRIESENFHSWEKTLTVRPALVTTTTVKLFPLKPELVQITNTNINQVFFTEDGSYAYYTVNDPLLAPAEQGFFRIKIESQETFFRRNQQPEKLAGIDDKVLTILREDNLIITPDIANTKILITTPDYQKIFIYDLTENNSASRITDLRKTLGFTPVKLEWFNNTNSVLVEDEDLLFEFNLINQEKTIISFNKDQSVIYSTNNEVVFVYSPIDRKIYSYQNKLLSALDIPSSILPFEVNSITITEDASAILLKSGEEYYYLDVDSLKISLSGTSLELLDFSHNGLSAIFQSGGKITTLTVERILANNDISLKLHPTELDSSLAPRFIYGSNLIVFNDEANDKFQVSENDGSNIITMLDESNIDNGYFEFQQNGSSLVVLLENNTEENTLNRNLFKTNLSSSSLPFNL